MKFSIIVPAYKEKKINDVLKLLLKQSLSKNWKLDRIFVIACGYENFSFLKNKKIEVIEEVKRKGKAYAINLALKKAISNPKLDIIVVHNADVVPKKRTLRKLLNRFEEDDVGIVCVRPISMDSSKNFVGFVNNTIWEIHHQISLKAPKVGEVFAFRNMIKKIPKRLAADEAYIESIIRKKGYKVAYVPDAIVFNRGPEKISDLITQRRRIFTGHVHIKNKYGYEVSTMNVIRIIKALLRYMDIKSIKSLKKIVWLSCAMFLETYARLLGTIDFYVFKKVPHIWKIIKTSDKY